MLTIQILTFALCFFFPSPAKRDITQTINISVCESVQALDRAKWAKLLGSLKTLFFCTCICLRTQHSVALLFSGV